MDKDINGNGCRVVLYSSLGEIYGMQNADNLSSYNSAVWDSDGLLTQFTISDGTTKYFRLQADYIGADSIVTINETIG